MERHGLIYEEVRFIFANAQTKADFWACLNDNFVKTNGQVGSDLYFLEPRVDVVKEKFNDTIAN